MRWGGWGMGRGISLPSRLGGLVKRRSSPSRVRDGAPAENENQIFVHFLSAGEGLAGGGGGCGRG